MRQPLKRQNLREQLWPGSSAEVWNRKVGKGFTTIPRTLGLMMTLIEELTERKEDHDVWKVYFELWCRAFDEGFLDGPDEESCAFAAGFTTERSVCDLGRNALIRWSNSDLYSLHHEEPDRKVTF